MPIFMIILLNFFKQNAIKYTGLCNRCRNFISEKDLLKLNIMNMPLT